MNVNDGENQIYINENKLYSQLPVGKLNIKLKLSVRQMGQDNKPSHYLATVIAMLDYFCLEYMCLIDVTVTAILQK